MSSIIQVAQKKKKAKTVLVNVLLRLASWRSPVFWIVFQLPVGRTAWGQGFFTVWHGLCMWSDLCYCSGAQSCPTLCDPMDCSTPGFPVHHYLSEFAQTLVHWVCDAIQPSHLLSSPSPPAFNLSQKLGLFQWVGSSHQVAKVLELQFQYQSFQWIFRVDFL